uniref:RING-CH-type domain-containing protein n=1 Tax=Aegilops tauschii TaxID=37682 RepID=M8CAT0_AEGTA
MADHFVLITGRMITEATLQGAIFDAPSAKDACDHHDPSIFEDGRTKTGVVVECRICQEEGDQAYMETPCSCKGSLKASTLTTYASRGGVTRRETPYVRYAYRRAGETPANLNAGENVSQIGDHAAGTSSFDSQFCNPKGVTYCRVIAIAPTNAYVFQNMQLQLMALLVLRDAISLVLGGPEVYSMALITDVHGATPVTEPVGTEDSQSLPPTPPQQHVISIQ